LDIHRVTFAILCVTASAVAALPAFGQSYPNRPVRVIAPFPPGGSTDVYARILAKELSAGLGQTFIIDNRPGGTGIIGTQTARQATPDGYTLLFTSNTGHVIGPLLRQPRPFDPVGDFTPVAMAVRFPLYLIVNPALPVKTVKEFVAYAKGQQGKLNYASSGEGGLSHICALLFNTSVGITATHIPYKGAAPGQQAVVSGEAQYRFDNLGTSQPLVVAGRLRGLALTGTSRSPAAPDIPTLAELGVKGLDGMYVWLGLLGPRELPASIRDRLSREIVRVLKTPDLTQKAARDGYDIVASTPAQFAKELSQEIATLERVIKENGIKTE
jgi:tripartite-type tricarboxylate transporter receptor subunit TctC